VRALRAAQRAGAVLRSALKRRIVINSENGGSKKHQHVAKVSIGVWRKMAWQQHGSNIAASAAPPRVRCFARLR
jgi:hypothetical protein